MVGELTAVRDAYATPRRTEIIAAIDGIEDEDLIEREDMVVTVTMEGYIKRTSLDTFRAQKRGGKGRAGMATKDEDAVTNLFVTSTHTPVLFFSTAGKVYRLKVWRLPEGGPATRGRPMINLLPLATGETISTVLPLPRRTRTIGARSTSCSPPPMAPYGAIRWTPSPTFPRTARSRCASTTARTTGLIGVALLAADADDVLLATRQGKAIRFSATDVREFQSRTSTGGARHRPRQGRRGDLALDPQGVRRHDRGTRRLSPRRPLEGRRARGHARARSHGRIRGGGGISILTVTANGYGKRTSAFEYRRTNRGGQGITNIVTSERNGPVVASFPARSGEQLMLVTDQAKLIRTTVGDIRVGGRNTQGVTIFRVADDEHVVSAARIEESEDEAEVVLADGPTAGTPTPDADTGEDFAGGTGGRRMSDRPNTAYKVLTEEQMKALEVGSFAGAPADLADGFIHLSTADQLAETLARHFAGQERLWLAAVDLDALDETVKWEPSRGGNLFPHIYGPLPLKAVIAYSPLEYEPRRRAKIAGCRLESASAHCFLHERDDPGLLGVGEISERECRWPHGALIELRLVAEAERCVSGLELARALEEADDIPVPRVGGHSVPGSRRKAWRACLDEGVKPLGHRAIGFLHPGDRGEHIAFAILLARSGGDLQFPCPLLYCSAFVVAESAGPISGSRLGRLTVALAIGFHGSFLGSLPYRRSSAHRSPLLFGGVTHRLDVDPVGIEHERAVIVRVIPGPEPGAPLSRPPAAIAAA